MELSGTGMYTSVSEVSRTEERSLIYEEGRDKGKERMNFLRLAHMCMHLLREWMLTKDL